MAVRTKVNFYYDILSPYAWFGFEALCRYQNVWQLDLQLKPLNIKRIMSESGNIPPSTNEYKRDYMISHDVRRISDMMSLPYNPQSYSLSVLQRGSTACMKTLAACQILFPDHLEELSRQSWLGLYYKNIDITASDNIRMFAEAARVPNVDELLLFSQGNEARSQFITNTQEALDSKCFGVPWFTVVNPTSGQAEALFGHDRVEMLGWIIGADYHGQNPPHSQVN